MILHIGNGKTVRKREIIGIFDLDNVTVRATGKKFISRAAKEGRVEYADEDIPRSFILIDKENYCRVRRTAEGKRMKKEKARVLLSHISSVSLTSRAESFTAAEEEEK